jgi:glycosyltransferase involved in cell wall biosynthesis
LKALHKVSLSTGQRRVAAGLRLFSELPVTVTSAASGAMERLTDQLLADGGFGAVLAYRVKMAPYALRWRGPRYLDYCDALTRYHERRTVALTLAGRPMAAAWSRLQARRLAAYEAWCAGQFNAGFFNAQGDRDALAAMHPKAAQRLQVAANGVDAAYFKRPAGHAREPKTLLFVGHLAYAPNAEAVLWFAQRVLPLLRAQDPGITFKVLGGDAPPAVQALAGQPGVRLLGFAPDTRPHLWSASLSVCPVRTGAGRQNKVLEAFAAGLPVVSTALAAQGAEAQAGRHLAVADEPADFAAAVLGLLKAPAKARRLSLAAQSLLKARYSWTANAAVIGRALARTKARAGQQPLW